jgi:hypothetical protein
MRAISSLSLRAGRENMAIAHKPRTLADIEEPGT